MFAVWVAVESFPVCLILHSCSCISQRVDGQIQNQKSLYIPCVVYIKIFLCLKILHSNVLTVAEAKQGEGVEKEKVKTPRGSFFWRCFYCVENDVLKSTSRESV